MVCCYVSVLFPTGGERCLVTLSDGLPFAEGVNGTGAHGLVQTQLAGRSFCLDAAWLNEGRCPGGRPSVSDTKDKVAMSLSKYHIFVKATTEKSELKNTACWTLACLNGSAHVPSFLHYCCLGECLMHFWFSVRGNRATMEVGIHKLLKRL